MSGINNQELTAKYGTPEELADKFDKRVKKIELPAVERKYKVHENESIYDIALKNISGINTRRNRSAVDITFDQALDIFKRVIISTNANIKYTPEETLVIHDLVKYFINDNSGSLNLDKGIFITGYYGSGKSRLMSFLKIFTDLMQVNKFEKINYKVLNDGIKVKGIKLAENLTKYSDLLIDDLGFAGESKIMNYGNSYDLLTNIVNDRYEKWFYRGTRTYYTSNLTINQINSIYDEGISGRIADSCNVISFNFEFHRL